MRNFGSAWRKRRADGTFFPGFYVSFPLHRTRHKRFGGSSKAEARRTLARIETLLDAKKTSDEILHEVFGDAVGGQRTFVQLAELYKQRKRKRETDADTVMKDNRRIDSICRAPWARKLVGQITRADIQHWLDDRYHDTSAPTANRDRAKASAIFKWGLTREFTPTNPVIGSEKFDESGREREVYLSKEEALALIRVACPILRTFLVLALATGMRRGAIMKLRWGQIDLDHGFVTMPIRTKTKGLPPRLPMTAALRSELLSHRATLASTGHDEPVFPIAVDTMRDHLRRARAACHGIPEEKRPKVGFHALRHTAASWMVQDGRSLLEVGRILGHSTPAVTAKYAHLVPGWAQGPIDSLGARIRPEDLSPRRASTPP